VKKKKEKRKKKVLTSVLENEGDSQRPTTMASPHLAGRQHHGINSSKFLEVSALARQHGRISDSEEYDCAFRIFRAIEFFADGNWCGWEKAAS
jgi:hypothetical protein